MQQRKRPTRSRSQSNVRTYTARRGSKKRGLLYKLGYKKVGLSFVMIGLVIGSAGALLFWQQVDALDDRGWSYVGVASQYQDNSIPTDDMPKKQVIVNVYACKEPEAKSGGEVQQYKVKSYATLLHESVDTTFSNPRLEILARSNSLKRYSTSEIVNTPLKRDLKVEAPYTEKAFIDSTVLYYGFNNYFQDRTSGSVQYAIGTVANLTRC